MFRELVELGWELERKLQYPDYPPPVFYCYDEPIKWVVHFSPNRVYLEAAELKRPRPFCGRTSSIQAHLLVDEAGYALGVAKNKAGAEDNNAVKKHESFRQLIQKFLNWGGLKDAALRQTLVWLEDILDSGLIQKDPRFNEILTKDWISFVPEVGPLAGQHLFEHPEAMAFWLVEMQERSAPGSNKFRVIGECAICGRVRPLVGKIPLKVKLGGTKPLHSLDNDSFISFLSGSNTSKKAHLGVCFECGDTASRAFNYLINSDNHHRFIVRDKKHDNLANQAALFWLKAPAPLQVGEIVFDLSTIDWGVVVEDTHFKALTPQSSLSQLLELLEVPWKPVDSAFRLDDYGFYLALVSPNKGRIAVREWLTVSLAEIKRNLLAFLEATRMVSAFGESVQPLGIGTILESLGTKNPNMVRGFLRTAYLGIQPPEGLKTGVVSAFRKNVLKKPNDNESKRLQAKRMHALASAIKLSLFYRKEEVSQMSMLNDDYRGRAYLCGRLLAILEEAQLRASNFNLKRSLVERFYGAASTAPATTFGTLIRLATTAHLPKVSKDMTELMQEVMSRLVETGGFPKTLNLVEQAEFGLGFYHQRAAFRASRGKNSDEGDEGGLE
ncbi:MAG TPA: type I-C CRISPR-associated protein Cas8c/Csd1 [Haloplasmataceae bacterium]